jgi:ribosomal protein S19
MGKQSMPRRLSETEAQAVARNIRVSPHKLGEFAPTRTFTSHAADKKAKRG